MAHYLTTKLPAYLQRLKLQYQMNGSSIELEIIESAHYRVIEAADFDSWNGGAYGHDVQLFIPMELLKKLMLLEQEEIAEKILSDLKHLSKDTPNEYYRKVRLELADDVDPDFQSSIAFISGAVPNPDTISIWKPGLVRLFISHKDQHKAAANELAQHLDGFGISAFVAHETIEPTTEWRTEILKGLETMEVMLVLLTDDFHESVWTNQEIGFAVARKIPTISLKVGIQDPQGFISHMQAMRGDLTRIGSSVNGLFGLIAKSVGKQERLNDAIVNAFIDAPNFIEARARFDRMAEIVTDLSDTQLERIIKGFQKNDQLHNANYLTNNSNRLIRYLLKVTGSEFEINGKNIAPILDDDIPF